MKYSFLFNLKSSRLIDIIVFTKVLVEFNSESRRVLDFSQLVRFLLLPQFYCLLLFIQGFYLHSYVLLIYIYQGMYFFWTFQITGVQVFYMTVVISPFLFLIAAIWIFSSLFLVRLSNGLFSSFFERSSLLIDQYFVYKSKFH